MRIKVALRYRITIFIECGIGSLINFLGLLLRRGFCLWLLIIFFDRTQVVKLGRLWLCLRLLLFLYSWLFLHLLYLRCLLFLMRCSWSFIAWENLWCGIRFHGHRGLIHHHHLHEHFVHLLSLSWIVALVLCHHLLELHHHVHHHLIICWVIPL